jgi:hypothetical protein
MVGCTTRSRGEVPGERKSVMSDDDDDDDDDKKKKKKNRDITHNKESATIWILKTEWCGAALVQEEKYQGKGNL